MYKYLITLVCLTVMLVGAGCAQPQLVTNPDGTVSQRPAVSTFQARLSASTLMGSAILAGDIPAEDLQILRQAFSGMNATVLILLKEEIEVLEGEALLARMREQYAEPLGRYYSVVEGVLVLLTTTIRPLIDQQQTDLASKYVDSVFSGAISAVDLELMRLEKQKVSGAALYRGLGQNVTFKKRADVYHIRVIEEYEHMTLSGHRNVAIFALR